MRSIEFCFDYISPYAYLSWTQARSLGERQGVEVIPRPLLFAGLLSAHGTRGPAEVPAKKQYMLRDVLRKAHALGVDIEFPPAHPFNPLLALRVTCAAPNLDAQRKLIDGLFSAAWREQRALDDVATVREVVERANLDANALLEAAASDRVKATLRSHTEEAIAQGIFGVPTWVADGELFWGVDSHPLLEAHLEGRAELDADKVARWLSRPSSASRKNTP
jgi:2-hydroxychromene-2-carboxylate isomerase